MSWATYLQEHTNGEIGRVVADRLGVTESNVSRWRRGGQTPDAKHVVNFARVYGRPVLEALIAAEYLTEAEAKVRPQAALSLDSLSDDDLIDELRRRMSRGGGGDERDAAPMNVKPLREEPSSSEDETPVRRAARDIGRKSAGQQHRAHLDQVGEHSQDSEGQP